MIPNTSILYRYGRQLNTHDALKILGIAFMVIDHIGWYLMNDYMPFRLLGRMAAPFFFFLIGFTGKMHVNVFLIVYGLILSLTGGLYSQHFWINILLNFILINTLLYYYPLEQLRSTVRIFFFIGLLILTPFVYRYLEYGFLGILIAYAARSTALKESSYTLWLAASLFVYGFYQAVVLNFFSQPLYIACLITLLTGLYYLFSRYSLRPLPISTPFILPGLFLSRYSLHIYFYHVLLLQFYIVLTSPSAFYLIGLW